jgi:transcriptional regulator with XRE-family HTH domain
MNTSPQLPPPDGFGNRLRRTRLIKGLTCAELGGEMGVPRSAVSRWEAGKTRPTIRSLRLLSRHLGVAQAWLAYGEGPMEIAPDPPSAPRS